MVNRVRIVLVEPAGPTNVGAVARAMANFGLSDLCLVNPQCDHRGDLARTYAVRAKGLLETARVVPDIPTALADCVTTFATSARLGQYRRQAALPPEEAVRAALDAAAEGPVAFAFGREDNGLYERELLHFDRIVTIPSDDAYPTLNLAGAVLIMSYELYREQLRRAGQPALRWALEYPAARDEQKRVALDALFEALDGVGFFFGQSPDHLRFALRHLFGRLDMNVNEADILIGMARQIRWYVEHHPQRIDRPAAE